MFENSIVQQTCSKYEGIWEVLRISTKNWNKSILIISLSLEIFWFRITTVSNCMYSFTKIKDNTYIVSIWKLPENERTTHVSYTVSQDSNIYSPNPTFDHVDYSVNYLRWHQRKVTAVTESTVRGTEREREDPEHVRLVRGRPSDADIKPGACKSARDRCETLGGWIRRGRGRELVDHLVGSTAMNYCIWYPHRWMETLSALSSVVPPSLTTMNVNAGIMPRRASADYDNQVFTAASIARVAVIYGNLEKPGPRRRANMPPPAVLSFLLYGFREFSGSTTKR